MSTAEPKVIVTFFDDHIGIEDRMSHSTTHKTTNLENLQRAFSTSQALESPLLPGLHGTQKYLQRGDRHMFVITEPPRQNVEVKHQRSGDNPPREYTIPIPATMWVVIADGDPNGELQFRQSFVYALGNNPIMSEDDPVYFMPFGNVYDDQRICWGSHQMQLGTSKSLTSMSTRFWNAIFNSDLDGARTHNFEDIDRTRQLFEHLQQEHETFPVDKMVRYRPFSEVVQQIINNNM